MRVPRAICAGLATAALLAASSLQQEIEHVAHGSGGSLGATATLLETGQTVSYHGSEAFPMASSYKIPIAVQILKLVDEGKLSLDRMVELKPSDLHPGSGMVSEILIHPGVILSIENLMELMLLISDNSAADVLLREAGGPAAVTQTMRALGLEGIRVDRPTAILISDETGARPPRDESQWTPQMWERLYNAVPEEAQRRARRAFDADPRDTATPDAMNALIVHIWKKDILKPESAELLLDIMRRCQTGKSRLKGILPEGTEVAHKTGTMGGTTNDVGIITLPNNAGHVAISVFVKGSYHPAADRERAIAEVSRAAYDYFLFTR